MAPKCGVLKRRQDTALEAHEGAAALVYPSSKGQPVDASPAQDMLC